LLAIDQIQVDTRLGKLLSGFRAERIDPTEIVSVLHHFLHIFGKQKNNRLLFFAIMSCIYGSNSRKRNHWTAGMRYFAMAARHRQLPDHHNMPIAGIAT